MTRTIALAPLYEMPPLSFEYDDETGALAGRGAKIVGDFIADAERQRFVPIEQHPQGYRIGQAPHSLVDLAAIFAADNAFELPDWLDALRPLRVTASPPPSMFTKANRAIRSTYQSGATWIQGGSPIR